MVVAGVGTLRVVGEDCDLPPPQAARTTPHTLTAATTPHLRRAVSGERPSDPSWHSDVGLVLGIGGPEVSTRCGTRGSRLSACHGHGGRCDRALGCGGRGRAAGPGTSGMVTDDAVEVTVPAGSWPDAVAVLVIFPLTRSWAVVV